MKLKRLSQLEIKSIRDKVDAITFREQEKVAKKQANQPKPEW